MRAQDDVRANSAFHGRCIKPLHFLRLEGKAMNILFRFIRNDDYFSIPYIAGVVSVIPCLLCCLGRRWSDVRGGRQLVECEVCKGQAKAKIFMFDNTHCFYLA